MVNGLYKLKHFRMACCVKLNGAGTHAELYHFSDASDHAYGPSYLRLTAEKHTVHVAFMFGKATVAPLMQITIPCLKHVSSITAVK